MRGDFLGSLALILGSVVEILVRYKASEHILGSEASPWDRFRVDSRMLEHPSTRTSRAVALSNGL